MPFTNVFDNTFPADTQLANLLGSDARGLALNIQERMASISGLDAAKPAFGADTQPAKWNGVLFFATDTGKIYKWTNPAWVDITTTFLLRSTALRNVTPTVHTGTTTLDTIYNIAIAGGLISATGQIRITVDFRGDHVTTNNNTFTVTFGGTTIGTIGGLGFNNIMGETISLRTTIIGGNSGATNTQRWEGFITGIAIGGSNQYHFGDDSTSAIDTTASQNLAIKWQSGANAEQQTFIRTLVEFI